METLPARTILPSTQRLLDPPTLLDDLLDQLVAAYSDVDAVYHANGLALSEKPRIHAQVITSGGGSSLEVFASNFVPFGFDATVDAVWTTLVASTERAPMQLLYKSPKVAAELSVWVAVYGWVAVGGDVSDSVCWIGSGPGRG